MWPTGRRQSPGLLQWEKNATGRQLARVSAIHYHETLWSDLFPGNRPTVDCLEPAILGVETSLELAEPQRRRTVYRLDGGAGTDGKLRWLLQRGYQVVAKGFSGRRAFKLGQQVARWDHYRPDAWLGSVARKVQKPHPDTIRSRLRCPKAKGPPSPGRAFSRRARHRIATPFLQKTNPIPA
jgi:hypothetical protein